MLRAENGSATRDPKAMADIFQSQFSSVYSNPAWREKREPEFQHINAQMSPDVLNFTELDFVKAARDLKTNSAPGSDGIPSQLIKECSVALSVPMAMIWN